MCDECNWSDGLDRIKDLLSNPKYQFASDTLEGIADWVSENEHITENQIHAIDNIEGSRS